MQLIATTAYGCQRTITATATLRCLAPLLSRQDLAEVLTECVQAMLQNERPKMQLFVRSAEECVQKAITAVDDNEAVMFPSLISMKLMME